VISFDVAVKTCGAAVGVISNRWDWAACDHKEQLRLHWKFIERRCVDDWPVNPLQLPNILPAQLL
jgi:hypothetical protein